MKTRKQKPLLTRIEAAQLLSISLTTLKTWRNQGIIKAYKLGGRIYFKEQEILAALKSCS